MATASLAKTEGARSSLQQWRRLDRHLQTFGLVFRSQFSQLAEVASLRQGSSFRRGRRRVVGSIRREGSGEDFELQQRRGFRGGEASDTEPNLQ